jgi:hypothetical protein
MSPGWGHLSLGGIVQIAKAFVSGERSGDHMTAHTQYLALGSNESLAYRGADPRHGKTFADEK